MPNDVSPALEQFVAKSCVAPTICDVPLPCRDYFKWLVAFLEELDSVSYRLRIANHVAASGQKFNSALLGGVGGGAGEA